jgi:hypothetical protein
LTHQHYMPIETTIVVSGKMVSLYVLLHLEELIVTKGKH